MIEDIFVYSYNILSLFPGALSLNNSDSVITCLNCFDTLTHQWIENERMKVPLEMRQYNWMPVPQPPPPSSTTITSSSSIPSGNSSNNNNNNSDITKVIKENNKKKSN